ncbi:MAG TPA: type II toxin-antitoxin system PemK/MazF family toxin [Blastocatellia bacterium]|nr:type II toxin-antitoxin system PemK/MazF family toxin [Blastocatellia bacterium]
MSLARRGEVWLADLDPVRGSEQAGTRPVLVFQNNVVSKFTVTVLCIPFTANLRRAGLPTSVEVKKGEGGLTRDSVALCHQLRVIDMTRLQHKLGKLNDDTLAKIEGSALFTLGIT